MLDAAPPEPGVRAELALLTAFCMSVALCRPAKYGCRKQLSAVGRFLGSILQGKASRSGHRPNAMRW
jgi:hypothetical protein